MNAIEWSAKAVRQLRKIADKRKRQGIFAEVQQLARWPDCPGDIKRLQGRDGYRLRIGGHRVIFPSDIYSRPERHTHHRHHNACGETK